MEGAGVWDVFPTIIIKGVCDYADSHKNKKWQKYSSVTAAACAKALLHEWRGLIKTLLLNPGKIQRHRAIL
jgi:nucleoside phosphorylase